MSEVKRFPFDFGHKFGYPATECPVCRMKDTLCIDISNEQNIGFACKHGCTRVQILDAVGADPEAIYYLGIASVPETSTVVEGMTMETAQQWLQLFSVATFPDLARLCKKANNGTIPLRQEGVDMDEIAAVYGYRITADRRSYYQPPTIANASDLMDKELIPPEFAVEGLLPAGLCIFSAPSKTGKSWLAIDLCNAVANGLDFMGRPTNQGDVLYLALEDSEYGLQKRMRKIGCQRSANLSYAFTVPCVGSGMMDFFTNWCISVAAPRLIVIDVLQRAKPTGGTHNKTAYEQDYDLYAPLNAFALETGIAIVAITHNRKSNGLAGDDYEAISGSVGQMGAAQTTWLIIGKRGQKEEKTFKATGRDIREVEDLIHFNPDNCKWENLGNIEAATEQSARNAYKENPIRKTLIELLDVDGAGIWHGKYSDLYEEIAEKTGRYPFQTPNELAKGIRPLLPLLSENDGVLHKKDTNRSGYHTFYRKTLRGV